MSDPIGRSYGGFKVYPEDRAFDGAILREADRRLPPVAGSPTLVIHMADPSTDFLKAIYMGKGYDVIDSQISPEEL
jgi:hypothetical protein